jgi:hypothetical protein
MDRKQFEATSVPEILESCREIRESKGQDYDPELLRGYYKMAEELDLDPKKVLWIYAKKHILSIETFIRTNNLESEPVESRIYDLINYLLMLHAMIQEKSNG